MRRVVVTGMSQISPLGVSREDAFKRLLKMKNRVKYLRELEQ